MNANDKEHFRQNVDWFNRFFEDLQLLFEKIAKSLGANGELTDPSYYYPKFNVRPSIPRLYVMGVSGVAYTLQFFAILDLSVLENNPDFEAEPSLIVVKHSQPGRALWISDFGLRVIQNTRIERVKGDDNIISGVILGDPRTLFHAFQVPLERFAEGQDAERAIQETIVEVLRRLPAFATES